MLDRSLYPYCLFHQTEDFRFFYPISLFSVILVSVAIKTNYESKKSNNPDRYKYAARNQIKIHVSFSFKNIQLLRFFNQVYQKVYHAVCFSLYLTYLGGGGWIYTPTHRIIKFLTWYEVETFNRNIP